MSNDHPAQPPHYTPDETPPPPSMPPASRPEADEPRDLDSDTAGGGGKMPQPKEGKGDPRERAP